MSRPSGFLTRMNIQKAAEMHAMRMVCLQQCKDIMLIAANAALGSSADDLKKLSDVYDAVYEEHARDVVADAKDDKEIWYSTGTIERLLQDILGDYYVPREERYC